MAVGKPCRIRNHNLFKNHRKSQSQVAKNIKKGWVKSSNKRSETQQGYLETCMTTSVFWGVIFPKVIKYITYATPPALSGSDCYN